MTDWSALNTFYLDECYIGAPKGDLRDGVSIWSSHPNLVAVHLRTFNTFFSIRHCLGHLPPSVKILSIDDDLTYSPPHFCSEFIACLASYSPQLTELSLLGSPPSPRPIHVAHGRWGPTLRRMTHLRKLAISPCAVDNLASTLAPLQRLVELNIVQTHVHSHRLLGQYEVLELLRLMGGLRRLRLGYGVWTRWTGFQLRRLGSEAERAGIELLLEMSEGEDGLEGGSDGEGGESDGESEAGASLARLFES